jgi:L-fuculose-phosphate aldolase
MSVLKAKQEVAEIMQRLYQRGLTTCSGGNVSMRLGDESILITASQSDKGRIQSHHIVHIAKNGENFSPDLTPSMEIGMHIAIYKKRPDVKAIVHAHPPKATAWACSKKKLENNLCGEARYFLGEIAQSDYHLMGTTDLADTVATDLGDSDAILLKNHGALTLGESLFQAYDRMEVMESLAELQILVSQIANPSCLTVNQIKELDEMRNKKRVGL